MKKIVNVVFGALVVAMVFAGTSAEGQESYCAMRGSFKPFQCL